MTYRFVWKNGAFRGKIIRAIRVKPCPECIPILERKIKEIYDSMDHSEFSLDTIFRKG